MASKGADLSTKELDELIGAVDSTMDRLKTLYEQYFMGLQKQAPSFIHNDVERKLRDLTQMNIRNTGLRYRLATLQQKFGSYNSYWRRTLRQIENGTYARNLAKIGRDAARSGADIPEEILAKMPKRMREQVVRDRDAAIAIAKRRNQGEDAPAEQPPELDDDMPAAISEPAVLKRDLKTRDGAHVLSEDDGDLDFDQLFSAFEDDAPKLVPVSTQQMTRAIPKAPMPAPAAPTAHDDFAADDHTDPGIPAALHTPMPGGPSIVPSPRLPAGPGMKLRTPGQTAADAAQTIAMPRMPTPAAGQTQALPRQPTPAPGQTQALPRQPTPAPGQTQALPRQPTPVPGQAQAIPRPPVPGQTQALPRAATQPGQETQAIPRPPVPGQTQALPRAATQPGQETQAIPRPPMPGQTSAMPRMPTPPPGVTSPMPRVPTPPPGVTSPIPRAATQPGQETQAIPRAPSQAVRPNPVRPGASAETGPIGVESMSGPFPRPQTTSAVPRVAKPPAPAAPQKPPPGMTEADVNALHAKYVQAKQAVGEKVDASSREKLLRTINQTAPKIMEQYKASGVDFSVVVKDNQVVIKAKPKT